MIGPEGTPDISRWWKPPVRQSKVISAPAGAADMVTKVVVLPSAIVSPHWAGPLRGLALWGWANRWLACTGSFPAPPRLGPTPYGKRIAWLRNAIRARLRESSSRGGPSRTVWSQAI